MRPLLLALTAAAAQLASAQTSAPPVISNVAPDRLGVPPGSLRLLIEGVGFCASSACGSVLINGAAPLAAPTSWSATKVVVTVADPQSASPPGSSTAQVVVGGVASNLVFFSRPVPAISSLAGQGSWAGPSASVVSAASISFNLSLSILGASLTPADLLNPAVGGPLRAAIASTSGSVPVGAVAFVSLTNTASGAVTTVSANDTVNSVNSVRRLTGPAGVNGSLSIDLVVAARAAQLSLSPTSIAVLTASVMTALSSPAMLTSIASRLAVAAGVAPATITVIIDPASIVAPPPTSSTQYSGAVTQPTRGGAPFYIAGVASLSTVAASDISVLFGPFACLNVTKAQDDDLSAQYGVDPAGPLASQYWTYRISCTTPPGVGADLPIRVTAAGLGASAADPNFVFSYAAPAITGVVDAAGAAPLAYAYTAASGPGANGFPTAGTAASAVRLVGNNFFTPALMQQLCQSQLPASAWATSCSAAVSGAPASLFSASLFSFIAFDAATGRATDLTKPSPGACPLCGVSSLDYESIVFAMPPGQGAGIQLALGVAGLFDTSSRPATLVKYQAAPSPGASPSASASHLPLSPSTTPAPDILLFFAVNLVPVSTDLTVRNVTGMPSFLPGCTSSFASLLGLPPSSFSAVNLTDFATGDFLAIGSVRRQLSGPAGSRGVAVTYVVRLGKVVTLNATQQLANVLSSPTLAAPALRTVAMVLGASAGLPAAMFNVSVPAASIVLSANAPFSLSPSATPKLGGTPANGTNSPTPTPAPRLGGTPAAAAPAAAADASAAGSTGGAAAGAACAVLLVAGIILVRRRRQAAARRAHEARSPLTAKAGRQTPASTAEAYRNQFLTSQAPQPPRGPASLPAVA